MLATASALTTAGREAEAEPLAREAYSGLLKARGADHPRTIRAAQNLVLLLRQQQRWQEALPIAKDGYDRIREPGRVQLEPYERARYLSSYGVILSQLGQHEAALEPLSVARAALREEGDADFAAASSVLRCLADSCAALGRTADAARWEAELNAARASSQPSSAPSRNPTTAP
jgi:tetratricopeptide (TPR) repeat protein